MLDRLDIHVVLPRVDIVDLESDSGGESSAAVRKRVDRARAIQSERFRRGEVSVQTNAHLRQRDIARVCALDAAGKTRIGEALRKHGLSARAYGKVLRVARTIADLEGATGIVERHVNEALRGRVLDRETAAARPFAQAEVA